MKKVIISIAMAALPLVAMAYGEVGQWSSGWAQGVSEYTTIDSAGNSLYIACSEDKAVSMTLTVGGIEYGSYTERAFDLLIDGAEMQTPYDTGSMAGESIFQATWEGLRKAKTLKARTSDGKVIELPTKGSSKALPAWGTPEYSCLTDMQLPAQ